jgi:hypothetical protein
LLPGNSSLSSASTAAISCLWTYKSNNLDDIFNLIEWVIDWRLTPSELYFSNIHDKNKFFTNNTSCLQKCRIVKWAYGHCWPVICSSDRCWPVIWQYFLTRSITPLFSWGNLNICHRLISQW